MLEFVYQYII